MNRFVQTYYDNGQPSCYNKYTNHPLLPLAIALEPLMSTIDHLYCSIQIAKIRCSLCSSHNLTVEESAAVFLYAEEHDKPTLNSELNRVLRSKSESMIEPWFGFLKLFNTALGKLPTVNKMIWRGMSIDIAKNLRENEIIVWSCVSSCLSSMNTIKAFYLDNNSALCSIEAINGKSIRGYTRRINENEIVLLPGTRLRVKKNDYDDAIGRLVVHLVEICTDNHNLSQSIDNSISSTNKPSEHNSSPTNFSKTCNTTANIKMTNHVPYIDESQKDIDCSITTFSNGDRYEIMCKKGEKQSYSKYYENNRKTDEGSLADNRANGNGNRIYSNDDRYEGEFSRGKLHGYGVYSRADGYIYAGKWIANEPYGAGTSSWPNGNRYEGDHRQGKIQGHGTFISNKGDKYKGTLIDGKAHGNGVRTWPNGDQYVGDFEDDKKHGFGTYKYANGGEYRGNWKNDEMHDDGFMKWPSGSRYIGRFKNGKRHGLGKLTFADGHVQDGYWDNDKYMGSNLS